MSGLLARLSYSSLSAFPFIEHCAMKFSVSSLIRSP